MSAWLWLLVRVAAARDVDLKVHDMAGALGAEPVSVELAGAGGTVRAEPRDDGVAPDAVAGDHLYTARLEGLTVEVGSVRVRSGERSWEGGFAFDANSDPVLLVGLEPSGFAAATTREIAFLPGAGGPSRPGASPPGPTVPAATPGAPPAAVGAGGASRPEPLVEQARRTVPEGMAAGWAVLVASVATVTAAAWAAARRPPLLPPPLRARLTASAKGPYVTGDGPDLWAGPVCAGGAGASVGHGRHTPEELVIAALAAGATRIVVTDIACVEARGDAWAALCSVAAGRVDVLWVQG